VSLDSVASVALLVSCDMIACRACRIMSDRVAIVFRVDDEIGESGIMRHYRRCVIIGIYGSLLPVSIILAISGQKAGFGRVVETGGKGHCMARNGLARVLLIKLCLQVGMILAYASNFFSENILLTL